jgi:hypothetical protein
MPEKPRDYHGNLAQDLNLGGATNTFATVGVANALALRGRTNRRKATFVNDSAAVIYISLGAPAVVGSGKRLNATGGVYEIEPDNLGYIWRGDIFAIASGAGSNMTVCEEF